MYFETSQSLTLPEAISPYRSIKISLEPRCRLDSWCPLPNDASNQVQADLVIDKMMLFLASDEFVYEVNDAYRLVEAVRKCILLSFLLLVELVVKKAGGNPGRLWCGKA